MLSKIALKNFKLFKEETEVPLSNINLLTGVNGKGKSTVLQTFLLMKQAPEFNRTTDKLIFNGSYVQLGNIKDVKNIGSSQSSPIEFKFSYELEDKAFEIIYKFNAVGDDSLDANIDSIEVKSARGVKNINVVKQENKMHAKVDDHEMDYPFLFNLFLSGENINPNIKQVEELLNLSRIHYVSADRIGPKVYYSKNSLNEFASVGALGQNTVNVLWQKKDNLVYENLCENKDIPKTVLVQTEYWLSKIFNEARLKVDEIADTNLISLKISTNKSTDYFIPTNVGFGYSYILPIIVSGLIAQKGEILIVENPEAHIHPYAQSILSKFLTFISLNGVQIFVESHSEHILNGFRIMIHDQFILATDLNVLYFDEKKDSKFVKIKVDKDGGIDDWPPNFFDQATKDLNYLFGI
jgi:predicted ATPase